MWKKPILLAGLIAALGAGAARADEIAHASGATYLRSGPSTHDSVIQRVRAGTRVSVDHCQNRWCSVQVGHEDGYIARGLLSFNGGGSNSVAVEHTYSEPTYAEPTYVEPDYAYPDDYYGPSYYGGGPDFYYGGGGYYGGGYRHYGYGGHGGRPAGVHVGGVPGGFHGGGRPGGVHVGGVPGGIHVGGGSGGFHGGGAGGFHGGGAGGFHGGGGGGTILRH